MNRALFYGLFKFLKNITVLKCIIEMNKLLKETLEVMTYALEAIGDYGARRTAFSSQGNPKIMAYILAKEKNTKLSTDKRLEKAFYKLQKQCEKLSKMEEKKKL